MAETEHIAVAAVSDGTGGTGRPGTRVRLPVVELLTGRGFVTGKSGSGKSNTASVVAENLLDNGFGLLIVDVDGEYYGLKEAYEVLHVGGDEECDVQVTPDHAEKLATLALEENVPIILDVSSYLDEDDAEDLLTAVARHLFAKAKKQKQPFLLLVEEVHEYIPENGAVGECGKTLIKIGKRGRKHGLGVCGISQRPADVKKDFITQCDWMVWHRLTWDNDTNVVRRVLDRTYADAVEDLDDGEAFLETDWSGTVRRVQFDRKRTFDAGATPGLDEFERPDLKSVSDDLVSELAEISEERAAREDRIADLREELDRKHSRIAELEAELQDARDLSRMADQFVDALVEEVRGAQPGRTERERLRDDRAGTESDAADGQPGAGSDAPAPADRVEEGTGSGGQNETEMAFDAFAAMADDGAGQGGPGNGNTDASRETATAATGGGSRTNGTSSTSENGQSASTPESQAGASTNGSEGGIDAGFEWGTVGPADDHADPPGSANGSARNGGGSDDQDFGDALDLLTDEPEETMADDQSEDTGERSAAWGQDEQRRHDDRAHDDESRRTNGTVAADVEGAIERDEETATDRQRHRGLDPDKPAYVRRLVRELRALDPRSRGMLAVYHDQDLATPIGALLESGGGEDRNAAYAHNRTLRKGGFVEHVGRGQYRHRLTEVLADRSDVDLDPSVHASYVDWVVEQAAPA